MPHAALVGTGIVNSSSTTGTVTVATAVPAGQTVCGAIAWESAAGSIPTISSVADSRGNTWATDISAGGAGNVTVAVAIFSARIATALQVNDTITVTISAARVRWAMQYDAFDDVLVSPLDKTAHNDNPGSASSLDTGTTAATAQPYELDYAAFGFSAARTATIPAGWDGTAQVNTTAGSSDRALQVTYRYTAATGTQQGTLSLDSAGVYAACIATYKAWIAGRQPLVQAGAAGRAASW
jgi:hypothetical protein